MSIAAAWLISNVRQKMKRFLPVFTFAAAMACCAQEKQEPLPAPSPEERIQELEARIASLEKIVATLADELLLKDGRYMLRAGDTGMKVARRFEVTISELQSMNPSVNWNRLVVGQLLCVRREEPNKAPEPTTTAVTPCATP